jgi:hypothetical protein
MSDFKQELSDCRHEWALVPIEPPIDGEREFACRKCNMRRLECQYPGSRVEAEPPLDPTELMPPLEEPLHLPTSFTTEKPTQGGYYWWREIGHKEWFIVKVTIWESDWDRNSVSFLGTENVAKLDKWFGEWAGPLEPPT